MQDVKKGNAMLVCLFLLLLVGGSGCLIMRSGVLATVDTTNTRAQETMEAAIPPTPTPESAWADEQVSASFVLELVDRIMADHQSDMGTLERVSDTGMNKVAEVSEVGLGAVTAQGLGPWCALGICGLVVLAALVIMRGKGGKQ